MSIFKKKNTTPNPVKKKPKIKCPKCSKIVSNEAIQKAEEKSQKKLEESMKKFGTINVKAEWEITCNNCNRRVYYNPYDGKVSETLK